MTSNCAEKDDLLFTFMAEHAPQLGHWVLSAEEAHATSPSPASMI